jgi:hypothetical protein
VNVHYIVLVQIHGLGPAADWIYFGHLSSAGSFVRAVTASVALPETRGLHCSGTNAVPEAMARDGIEVFPLHGFQSGADFCSPAVERVPVAHPRPLGQLQNGAS